MVARRWTGFAHTGFGVLTTNDSYQGCNIGWTNAHYVSVVSRQRCQSK